MMERKNLIKIFLVFGTIAIVGLIVFFAFKFLGKGSSNNIQAEIYFDPNTPIVIKKDGKYGYIDTEGKIMLEPVYKRASRFYGDYAVIENDNGYHIIDKEGNEKIKASFSSDIKYIDEYNVWEINNQLYNDSLEKITSDNIYVDYESMGYSLFKDKDNGITGIMDTTGKKTYTYKFNSGEDFSSLSVSNSDENMKDKYCVFNVENKKYGIVNCKTGKVVYDFGNNYIHPESYNIFEITSKDDHKFVSVIYIQDDKILYQSSNKDTDFYFNYYGYIQISDADKDYSERYSYIDISTGKISSTAPNSSEKSLEDWGEYTKINKFECDNGYGLKDEKKEKLACEWSDIKTFDLFLYKYLSSKGKEYVLAKKDGETHLINLKDGKDVAIFNSGSISTSSSSTFIYYSDYDTNEVVVYNLVTGKNISFKSGTYIYEYSNYFIVRDDGKYNYYNANCKLIYTSDSY